MVEAARSQPDSALGQLLDQLTKRMKRLDEIAAGQVREVGASTWTWLHPDEVARYPKSNDESMVIRIETANRAAIVCGDIQREVLRQLIAAHVEGELNIAADIVELPHHGSYNEEATAFIRHVNPQVVMQSTGPRRWRTDRWATELADRIRLVTARDGACTVRIDGRGHISVERFRETSSP